MKSPARKNECVALCLPRRSRNASSEYGNCRKEKASRLNWMGKKFDSKRINIYQQRSYFAHESSCAGHRTRENCALSVMLTVSQLSKSFAGRALFDDVSLQVNRGDRIGLVGPNGAGKSTLFSLILGEVSPDNGTIAIEKNATIGFLPQETAAAGDATRSPSARRTDEPSRSRIAPVVSGIS